MRGGCRTSYLITDKISYYKYKILAYPSSMEYPTNTTNDMASAAKLMPKFTGADTEDSTIWIRDCKLVAKMAGFSEETTIRAMVLALDGSARTWASQTLQNMTDITLHDLENIITRRFSNQNTIDSTLSRFMNT